MGMRKITGFACMALAAVLMALPCHAGEKNNKHVKGCEACFANGTGKQISRISLISDDGKKYDFTVDLQDKAICVIGYPKELKKNGSVSVEVEFENGKTASTKVNEVFSFARRPADNVFLLSLKGKNSTVPIVSGTVAGGATAAAITGAASYCVAHWGAGGLTWLLAYFGGSMVTGLAFVSAVPVAIAAVTTGSVFAVRKWMMPETLVVQKLTKDQALLFSDNQ